jgi:uncharacterized protein YecT (DUF1311 family)
VRIAPQPGGTFLTLEDGTEEQYRVKSLPSMCLRNILGIGRPYCEWVGDLEVEGEPIVLQVDIAAHADTRTSCGIAKHETLKANDGMLDVAELRVRMQRGDEADAVRLLEHVRREHSRDQQVIQAFAEVLMEASQQTWSTSRSDFCSATGLTNYGGSMRPAVVATCFAMLARSRTEELRWLLE